MTRLAPSTAAIEEALQRALAPAALTVIDESHLHAGHAGAREGGHFRVLISSSRFIGLNRLSRHRLVYDALSDWLPHGIHALAIDAQEPATR
jgi:BolA family transcriptional regulator, general stress-responsive regulator